MKALLGLIIILSVQNSFATEYQLGVILGSPTGISGKASLDNNHSIDAVLAYSLVEDLGLEFHMDYLVEKIHNFSTHSDNPIEAYYGIGARFVSYRGGKFRDELAFGPRVPIGLSYQATGIRIEVFGELALVLDIIPATNLDLEGGIGIRYRF